MLPTSVTACAPGRVNLIGEHLDYNGGQCLPMAIDRTTMATVTHATDGRHHLRSGDQTWTGAPTERGDDWAAYVVGVLRSLGVTTPLDVQISSNVPIGAGLSSSAALECSVAVAVDALLGLGSTTDRLRRACIRAENDHVGVPTGGMDQTIALAARPGTALLLDFSTGEQVPVSFDPAAAGLALLVIDTGVRHTLVDGAYADRRADCETAAQALGLEHLALASGAQIASLPGGRIGRRARHIGSEQRRVHTFVQAVGDGDWDRAGDLMTASHDSLRDDYEVSCAELDLAVEAARAAGALGARMTGGGFGGCAIALVPLARAGAVSTAVTDGFIDNHWDAPTCFQVEASGGAAVVRTT